MLTATLVGAVLALLTTLPLAWTWELGVARSQSSPCLGQAHSTELSARVDP